MVLATWWGWGNAASIALAVALAFFFGYGLTSLPLLRSGMSLRRVAPLAFASDTASIATMEIVDNRLPLFFVQVHDTFGVGARPVGVAARLEPGTQRRVVVYFTVERNPHGAIFVVDRLMAGGKVDDREAAHPDCAGAVDVKTFVIRAAVANLIAHSLCDLLLGRSFG